MAMIQCKECGNPVSTEAKACPGCGAKPVKRSGRFALLFCALIAAAVAANMSKGDKIAGASSAVISTAAAATAKESAEDARFNFAFDVTGLVRKDMRNPDSLKWEAVRVNDAATIACLQYRSQNGFGGMGRESIVVVNRTVSKKASDLKKHCSQPMNDEITAAR